ncbi:MAG: amino acid transporter [Myxococcales bacterium]|nr:amino acid transporter [Myxococcales bacterium]USN49777.1 MAG: amino acid transporter [Myxococcales bacterium]
MIDLISAPLFHGFFLSLAMILAIGSQNIFILKQGMSGRYVLTACLTSSLCDAALIILGAMGLGKLVTSQKTMQLSLCLAGSMFLAFYAWGALRQFMRSSGSNLETKNETKNSMKKIIVMSVAFSLLNPHAWLDTVVVMGSVSSQYNESLQLLAFTIGACLVSFTWFFLLGFLAKYFRQFLLMAKVQRGLNLFVAIIMGTISFSLARYSLTLF